jgi:hypothetical protein
MHPEGGLKRFVPDDLRRNYWYILLSVRNFSGGRGVFPNYSSQTFLSLIPFLNIDQAGKIFMFKKKIDLKLSYLYKDKIELKLRVFDNKFSCIIKGK